MSPRWWFDGHLDLAYLAVRGRDLLRPLAELDERTSQPDPPAAVTLPSLREGGVRFALATIFTQPVPEPEGLTAEQYRPGDAEGAHRRGRAQLEVYLTLADRGELALDLPGVLTSDPGVGRVVGGMGVSEVIPESVDARMLRAERAPALHAGVLMENADPIRTPEELDWWADRGVCAVGMAWATPSRYATGNATPADDRRGLTALGRELVARLDARGVMHDASHLSDRALDELFSLTPARVIASHSNCRALLPDASSPQRHLTDASILEIARRGGVVGLNLYASFLTPRAAHRPANIRDALAHVERVCELTGSTRHVALGSDMDGGFSALQLPQRIRRPADLRLLAEALAQRGWSTEQLDDFAWRNLARAFADRDTVTSP